MTEQTRQRVVNLARDYGTLAALVAPHGGASSNGGRSATRVEAPLPINGDAADLRADIRETLAGWADYLRDDLAVELRVRALPTAATAPGFTAGLLLTFWPIVEAAAWFGDMVDEINELTARVDAITDPPERRTVADRIHEGVIDGRDAATVLGVSASMIRQWVASGELTPCGRGANGRNLYPVDDIRRLKIRRDNVAA